MVLFRITENEPSKMHNARPYFYSRTCADLYLISDKHGRSQEKDTSLCRSNCILLSFGEKRY